VVQFVEEYLIMQDKTVRYISTNNVPAEYDFVKKLNEKTVVNSLKVHITNCINQSTSALKLLNELNAIVKEYDNIACQIIFQVMVDLHLDRDVALEHWEKVHQHALWLNKKIGRPLPLVATMSDYFSIQKHKLISNTKLITYEHFDSLINHSTIDRLTGLFNRNCLSDTLTHLLALTQREDTELSFVFFDLDDFKLVNDIYGHQMGDSVLHKFGKLLSSSIRLSDIALRYGGEEFVVLMPNTERKDALMLSNRIRLKVKNTPFIEGNITLNISVSGGLAVYPTHAKTADELIYSADSALYRAKGAGKDNIKVFKNEDRHYLRVPLIQKIKIKEINFDGATIQEGICQNICFGGVLFETSKHFFVGDAIQVAIELNEDNPIIIFGSVVRVDPIDNNCFAIAASFSFGDMEKLAKNKIAGIIKRHKKDFPQT
jgi:diguanylate cyclase (GGDEF)-like protein